MNVKSILELIKFDNIGVCILFLLYFPGKTVFQHKLRTSTGMRSDSMLAYLDKKINMELEVTAKEEDQAEKRGTADKAGRNTK